MSAPSIETSRLLLRPWQSADREPWAAMCADPLVVQYLGPPKAYDRAILDAEIHAEQLHRNGFGSRVVALKDRVSFIGTIALDRVAAARYVTTSFEIGWLLRSEYWRNGYATEGGARGPGVRI